MKPRTLKEARENIAQAEDDYAGRPLSCSIEEAGRLRLAVDEAYQSLTDLKKRKEKENRHRREADASLRGLGLKKVRGAVSGRVYWE